jgi:dihydroorotase
MSNSYVLKNVQLASGVETDIEVTNDKITAIGSGLTAAETIDCTGLVALPGFVDLHTHLREPGFEQSETVLTGTQAAAMGGFTAVHASSRLPHLVARLAMQMSIRLEP